MNVLNKVEMIAPVNSWVAAERPDTGPRSFRILGERFIIIV